MNPHPNTLATNIHHYANPMVHPITGNIVSSYKKTMINESIGKIWQTAFGKEFGGLAQGDIKTKTIGTNAMFVMSHKDINAYKGKYTYARVCLDLWQLNSNIRHISNLADIRIYMVILWPNIEYSATK